MNRTARIQSAAGAATIVSLPLLYIGGTRQILPVTVIGFAIFAIGILATPALRFFSRWTEPKNAQRTAQQRPGDGGATRARES